MTNKYIACVLTIIAVLLAMDLVVKVEQPAVAAGSMEPTIVSYEVSGIGSIDSNNHRIWRFWSDGKIEMFLALLEDWGACLDCDDCQCDLDGDCDVGTTDLLELLNNWT